MVDQIIFSEQPSPPIQLVPGDSWRGDVKVIDASRKAVDLTGWSLYVAEVAWMEGWIDLAVDMSDAAAGVLHFTAASSKTSPLPLGSGAAMTIRARSPSGYEQTIYYAPVLGVPVLDNYVITVRSVGGI
jgi:hypothetical protein